MLTTIKHFFAGFTLAGYEQPDGSIVSVSGGPTLSAWPAKITIEGITFTFEYAEFVGREGNPRGRFMNAEYV